MKKSKKFIIGLIVVTTTLIILLFFITGENKGKDTNISMEQANESPTGNDGEYYEEGVDYNYNYIINGDTLKAYDIAYEIIENLGNDANQLFKDAGVHNEELEIFNISSKGTYVNFQIRPKHISQKIIYVECTKKSNNYTIYLKEW